MIIQAVTYTGEIKEKVDSFKKLPEKQGSYWNVDDSTLSLVKTQIKKHYIHEQDYTCAYCCQKIIVDHHGTWDIDHIIAKDTHPQFLFEGLNLCIACKDCNRIKYNKNVLVSSKRRRKTLPSDSNDYLIVHPHLDKYSIHIKILGDSNFYLPRTEKGRNTVEICGLLRFLYSRHNQTNIPVDVKIKIGSLQKKLMDTTDPLVEHFLLEAIADLTREGKEAAKKAVLSKNKDMLLA